MKFGIFYGLRLASHKSTILTVLTIVGVVFKYFIVKFHVLRQSSIERKKVFYCKYPEWEYSLIRFNWLINHTRKDTVPVKVLNRYVAFPPARESTLIYKILEGT